MRAPSRIPRFAVTSSNALPARLRSLNDLPVVLQALYTRDSDGYFRLHAGGKMLARLRAKPKKTRSQTLLPPAPDGGTPALTIDEWKQTARAASPSELRTLAAASWRREFIIGSITPKKRKRP